MKKIITILLSILLLALAVTAFAGGFSPNGGEDDPDLGSIKAHYVA